MANYNKSFNFRNGVQVDESYLLVNPVTGNVGIGTSIPTSLLDVRGTIKSTGLVTTTNLFVTGIATFSDVRIGTGITIDGNAGIISARFYGDGAGLYNIPTSQWVDVDPAVYPGVGAGYSSIFTGGTVGIATTTARSFLQIGGDPILGQNGVGINSTGAINATGVVTAGSFVGSGANITTINASNISSGTLSNSRLPSNISISGVVTATTFSGQVNAGVGTITTLTGTTGTVTNLTSTNLSGTIGTITTLNSTTGTVTNLTSTNLSGTIGTVTTLNSTTGTITNLTSTGISGTIGTVTTLNGTNLNYTGVATIGSVAASSATITSLTGTIGTVTTLNGTNLSYTGVATVGVFTATQAIIGVVTSTSSKSGSIQLGVTAANQVDTSTGDLVLDSNSGLVDINDNIDVLGTSVLQGEVTLNTGVVPDTSTGAYLGQTGKQFSEAWIGDLKISVGVGNSNKIETISQDLVLDSVVNKVTVDANFSVAGVSTFTGNVTLGAGIEPATDLGATLGSASKRFSSSQIGGIRVGVAQTFEIDTVSGTELVLNSSAGTTRINDNVLVSGIGSFGGEVTVDIGIIPDVDKGSYLGTSGKSFSEAFIDEVRIGVGATNKIDTRTGSLVLNAANNVVNVENNLLVSGISTLTGNITVGSNNELFVNTSTSRVGVGTNVLTRPFQVKSVTDLISEFRTDTSDVTIGIGRSAVGAGQSVGKLSYSSANKTLSLANEDLGGLEFISNNGNAGLNTGTFRWRWGQNLGLSLMDLTYDGKLGLGITNPSNTLHVVGTSTVTGNAFFGGDVRISGTLYGTVNLQSIIGSNISTTTGISTFNNIQTIGSVVVSTGSSIGIGTTVPIVPLDVRDQLALFGSVGVGTTTTNQTLKVSGSTLLQSVAIGNTTLDNGSGVNVYGGTTTLSSNTVSGINSCVVILDDTSVLGVGTTSYRAAIDFADAGKNTSGGIGAFMIVPRLNNSQRTGLSTLEGAVIFNTTTKKFQGFTGVAWTDFH